MPFPKIEKTVPDFLTSDELNWLIQYFAGQAHDLIGLRNLVIILLPGFWGIRTTALIGIKIEDVDVTSGLLWVYEKGCRHHNLILPHCVCKIVDQYLRIIWLDKNPFLIPEKKKRIFPRTLQDVFRNAADCPTVSSRLQSPEIPAR
ncbi:MAG: hypothetical protein KKF30_14000 [Proteobacteria bacterium]|nr:hypothetical protein [Pseudomonadota bacterium]